MSFCEHQPQLVDDIIGCHGILVTSYSSLTINQAVLHEHNWHYVILDEGHKIRNPDAQVTIASKQVRQDFPSTMFDVQTLFQKRYLHSHEYILWTGSNKRQLMKSTRL